MCIRDRLTLGYESAEFSHRAYDASGNLTGETEAQYNGVTAALGDVVELVLAREPAESDFEILEVLLVGVDERIVVENILDSDARWQSLQIEGDNSDDGHIGTVIFENGFAASGSLAISLNFQSSYVQRAVERALDQTDDSALSLSVFYSSQVDGEQRFSVGNIEWRNIPFEPIRIEQEIDHEFVTLNQIDLFQRLDYLRLTSAVNPQIDNIGQIANFPDNGDLETLTAFLVGDTTRALVLFESIIDPLGQSTPLDIATPFQAPLVNPPYSRETVRWLNQFDAPRWVNIISDGGFNFVGGTRRRCRIPRLT